MFKAFPLIILLLLQVTLHGQITSTWTSKNRVAVSKMEKALKEYEKGKIAATMALVRKAIKADSSFIEAYILMAEIAMDSGDDSIAIMALEYAVAISPGFFPNNLYNLGNMYIRQAQYEKALLSLNRYKTLPNQTQELLAGVERSIATCHFAQKAMKNPVNFNPINLGNGVNSAKNEFHPSLTVDEMALLFTRADLSTKNMDGIDENLYVSQFRDYEWQPARNLGNPVNTHFNEGAGTIAADGQTIVFTMCEIMGHYGNERQGNGSCDLFFSYKTGNGWTTPMNLGAPVNTRNWESQPALDANGNTLYFIRSVGKGNSDIYVTTLNENGNWMPPKPLGPQINTPAKEMSVFIHPDGQTLYFASEGHPGMGGLDIFMSRRTPTGDWGPPVNLGYPINTSKDESGFVISGSGRHAYFASDRDGGSGGIDIYYFELDPSLRPYPVTYLKGVVYDAETTKPLEARFELINLASGETVISAWSNPSTGEFLLSLPADQTYALNVNQEGYLFYSDHFELKGDFTDLKPFEKDIPLQPIKKGETVVLRNIFFDLDQFVLKPESMTELNRLATLLIENPGIYIEIGGHTDNSGSRKHNETLSENRAKAVYDYLISKNIASQRLTYKGYADDIPIADNRNEEGKAQNRRTEFKIIQY